MYQISINSEHFQFGTNLGLTGGKYFIYCLTFKSKSVYLKYCVGQILINSEYC